MLTNETAWYLLGAAAATSAYWVVCVFNANINHDAFLHVIEKVLQEKNAVRALKLTMAAGNVPLAKATRAAIVASVSREDDEASQAASYRDAPKISKNTVKQRIHNRYDEAFRDASRPLTRAFFLSIAALPMAAFTLTWALLETEKNWNLIGTTGATLLILLWIGAMHLGIVASQKKGFKFLWPALELVYEKRQTLSESVEAANKPETTNDDSWALSKLPLSLEILEPGLATRTFVAETPIIKIGTFESAHLQLSADDVGRMHAVIEMANGVANIIDLGTKSGTRVNGESIAKKELANGDVIAIGKAELIVRLSEQSETQQAS